MPQDFHCELCEGYVDAALDGLNLAALAARDVIVAEDPETVSPPEAADAKSR
jgi:hypothetical protein